MAPVDLGHALEVRVDRLVHPGFEQLGERLPRSSSLHSRPSACMAFIIANAQGS
jgi:hypothetical protein